MPAEHSTLIGGSTAERRMNCLASYKLEAAAPVPPSSKYAAEGTMLHSVVQRCLDDGVEPIKLTGYTEGGSTMTAALATELVEPALEALEQLFDAYDVKNYDLITEARVAYDGFDGFGTCDILISTDRWVFVVDWKFGRGVMVQGGANNQQLRFYAGAAMETVPEFFEGDKQIVLAIIQPSAHPALSHGIIGRSELEEWVVDMRSTIAKILDDDDVGDPVTGKWCRWCNAAPTCPSKHKQVNVALDTDIDAMIDPIELGKLVGQAADVELWAKSVRRAAYNELTKGRQVHGYKLVERRCNRRWDDEEAACAALLEQGVNDVFDKKVISPAKAEKLIKAAGGDKDAIGDLIVRPNPGLTMAADDDKRPAVFERGVRHASPVDLKLNR